MQMIGFSMDGKRSHALPLTSMALILSSPSESHIGYTLQVHLIAWPPPFKPISDALH
jgi:hypothetical protein